MSARGAGRPAAGARPRRVLLAVMPWLTPFMPSLAASLLQASLRRAGIACDVRYFNLAWDRLVLDAWARFANRRRPERDPRLHPLFRMGEGRQGEWVFARARFGPRTASDRAFRRGIGRPEDGRAVDPLVARFFATLPRLAPPFLRACAGSVAWERYGLVGFTSSFQQNLASIGLARELKRRHPGLPVLLGGANASGDPGAELLARFPEIDAVFSGEADEAMPGIAAAFLDGRAPAGVPGLLVRRGGRIAGARGAWPIVRDLDALPTPDYADYFAQYGRSGLPRDAAQFLPVELSRGCWWGARRPCVFCGLNGRHRSYRAKSADRALREIRALVRRWRIPRLFLVDTVYQPGRFRPLLRALARRREPVRFFAAIRASLPAADYGRLRAAGGDHVLPGIESFSTATLRRMNKGSTALANVLCLRRCREAGLRANWNILYGFPGEDGAELDAQADLLSCITHLDPPGSVRRVMLVRYSAARERARELGYLRPRPAPVWGHIYPFPEPALRRLCWNFDFDLPGGYDPEPRARPLLEFVRVWKAAGAGGALVFRRRPAGGTILDTRFNRVRARIPLDAREAALYEFCLAPRSRAAIERFAAEEGGGRMTAAEALAVLDRLQALRAMARDGDQWLAVAVPARRRRRGR